MKLRSCETASLDRSSRCCTSCFPIAESVSLKTGLKLSEANLLALCYSPDIIRARSNQELRSAVLLEAGLPNNPQIFLGPRLSSEDAGLIFPASLSFQFQLADRRGPRRAQARWELEMDTWLLCDIEITILANVQKGFLRVEAARAMEAIAVRQLERSKELIQWAQSLYSRGVIDPLTLQVAQRGHEDAKTYHMDSGLERRSIEREVLRGIGLLPDSGIDFVFGSLPILQMETPSHAQAQTVLSHPRLRAIETEYCAAEHALRAEVASQFPTLQIGPDLESDRGVLSLGIGVGFEVPVFTRNRTGIALAEENRNRVRSRYQETLLNLSTSLAALTDEFAAVTDRLMTQEAALLDAERLDRVFSDSFQVNSEGVLAALAASESLAQTLREQVDLSRRQGELKIDLLVVTGALLPHSCAIMECGGDDE